MESPNREIPFYDVAVIGAGPAGCEAALAACRSGMRVLCLSINLDTVGFPCATPVLVDSADDPRSGLLREMSSLSAVLPQLLGRGDIRLEPLLGADPGVPGRILIDRRALGLAWKETLENAPGVEPRQALITDLRVSSASQELASGGSAESSSWLLHSKFGEIFRARTVIVAAGTFLGGVIDDGGEHTPGGRPGEIPAVALAHSLAGLTLEFVELESRCPPRLDLESLFITSGQVTGAAPDCRQLGEAVRLGKAPSGGRMQQLSSIRESEGLAQAWVTRPAYGVRHLALAAGQVDPSLETRGRPGLFFAGRVAGSSSYVEAAFLGAVAGLGAAARIAGMAQPILSNEFIIGNKLCEDVAGGSPRPLSVNDKT